MAAAGPLTWEAFLYLAQQAGLDVNSPHMQELYAYAQNTLASIEPVQKIDLAGAEPDMAFIPRQE